MPNTRLRAAVVIASLLASSTAAIGSNLLVNAGFEQVSGGGPVVSLTGYSFVGESAAKDWYVFHNTRGTTITSLVPSTIAPGGTMLRVQTTGASNGIEQVLGEFNSGPACASEGIWVYVVSGSIFIGAGNGGQTAADQFLTTTGVWTFVTATNTFCPVNLFIVYAGSTGGAEFYVDNASVEPLNCIGPPGDFNADGSVNAADLSILLGSWGSCVGCPADLDQDGIVAGSDLAVLLANWGC